MAARLPECLWIFSGNEFGNEMERKYLGRFPSKWDLASAIRWFDMDKVKIEYNASFTSAVLTDVETEYKVRADISL